MSTVACDAVGRLLTAPPGSDAAPDLAGHLATHGPLTVPPGDDRIGRAAIGRAVTESGLLGRGGAGFPVGVKWDAVARAAHPVRLARRPMLVVNAMEGEPASAKDRMLLVHSPHLVLDGAEVAAAVIGASEIVVCVAEHSDGSADSVEAAIAERDRAGFARRPTSVRHPPARYVTGEESALIAWLNHRQALPVLRLDKSVPLEVARRPALVHNAETLALVALVSRHGPGWFRRLGTPDAPGTTLVTVTGAVGRPGVVEVELGTPVEDILARTGLDNDLSAVLIGGYGGTWLDGFRLSVPYAPAPLGEVGATLGAGVIVALPVTSCGIAETARAARYMAGQSAGQCGPCVFGLPALADDLEQLWAGRGDADVLVRIERRAGQIEGRGACRHPDGAVRLVRSGLAVFADDAYEHARGRPCSGHRATTVLSFPHSVPRSLLRSIDPPSSPDASRRTR
jgi:NADH:ubiquinone oxidoreductase subunit F (NADH-binding)